MENEKQPQYFATPAKWRNWLKVNYATASELVVGFHKRHTDEPSVTWPQAVAEALCFGWIDGVRRRIDAERYQIRFTPRRPGSIWSAVNIRLVGELEKVGKMTPAGRAAFAKRSAAKSKIYSYEQKHFVPKTLDRARLAQFRMCKAAWTYFESLPPSYQKKVSHWIANAKTDETKDRRLKRLIESCKAKRRLD